MAGDCHANGSGDDDVGATALPVCEPGVASASGEGCIDAQPPVPALGFITGYLADYRAVLIFEWAILHAKLVLTEARRLLPDSKACGSSKAMIALFQTVGMHRRNPHAGANPR